MRSEPLSVEECAFEPESTQIRCIECGKPTGEIGTCQDVGFCAGCRADLIDAGIAEGMSPEASRAEFSAMLISMIEGKGYNAKYVKRRVLHLSVNGKPACSAKGGPHPLTENENEANCKRCVTRISQSEA